MSLSQLHSIRKAFRSTGASAAFSTLSNVVDIFDSKVETFYESEEITKEREKCEASLHYALTQMWHVIEPGQEFIDGYHIGCVADHLEAFFNREIPKLIINIPPRHCKSILCCVALFCWGWSKRPESKWLYSSHAQELAYRDATKCRDVIVSPWYQSLWGNKFKLKDDQNTKKRIMNDEQGHRFSSFVGGGDTGEGGDYIVTDDPNSAKGAESAAERRTAVDYWSKTMVTRVNNPTAVSKLIVQQRLNRGDLSGYCRDLNLGYECLVLPIHGDPARIFIPGKDGNNKTPKRDDIIPTSLQLRNPSLMDRRKDRDILWPERFTEAAVEGWEKELRGAAAGQLEMRPAEEKGAMFKREFFRYCSIVIKESGFYFSLRIPGRVVDKLVPFSRCEFFQTIDTAMETKEQNDSTAIGTFALTTDGELIVFDMFLEKIEVPDQLPIIIALRSSAISWNHDHGGIEPGSDENKWPFEISWQGVETKSSGIGLVQAAKRLGITFRKLIADKSKTLRATPLLAMYESGSVYHLESGRGIVAYENQLTDFPNGDHDDSIDSAAYAGSHASKLFGSKAKVIDANRVMAYNPDEKENPKDERKSAPEIPEYWRNIATESKPRTIDDIAGTIKEKDKLQEICETSAKSKEGPSMDDLIAMLGGGPDKKDWKEKIGPSNPNGETFDDVIKGIEKTFGDDW